MAEYRFYDSEIANEVARLVRTELATTLGLKKCEPGDLTSMPGTEEFSRALNAVFVGYKGWHLEDLLPGAPSSSEMKPPGIEVEYVFELLFIRLQMAGEDPHEQLARGMGKIAALFLNGHRKLPGLQQPGCRVIRAVPLRADADNEYNDLFDDPQYGANAGLIHLHVFTRTIPV